MLVDSNIIIYAAQPHYAALRQFIADHVPSMSVISYIEVLGYHRLSEEERQYLESFFQAGEILPVSDAVVEWAIRLRQRRRVAVADAIIAGTALAYGRTLVTHDTEDFRWINELKLLDPLIEGT